MAGKQWLVFVIGVVMSGSRREVWSHQRASES